MHPQTHRSRCKATGPRIHRSAQRAFALNSVLTAPRPAGCRVQIISRASPARIDADHSVNRMSVTTPLTPRPLPCHPCTGTPRPNFRPVTGFKFFSLPSPVSPYFFAGLGIVHGVAAAAKDEIPGLIPAQLRPPARSFSRTEADYRQLKVLAAALNHVWPALLAHLFGSAAWTEVCLPLRHQEAATKEAGEKGL